MTEEQRSQLANILNRNIDQRLTQELANGLFVVISNLLEPPAAPPEESDT